MPQDPAARRERVRVPDQLPLRAELHQHDLQRVLLQRRPVADPGPAGQQQHRFAVPDRGRVLRRDPRRRGPLREAVLGVRLAGHHVLPDLRLRV